MQEAPPVVQALRAPRCDEGTTSHQSPSKRKMHSLHSQAKQDNSSSKTPSSSCCTRSRAAPDWTVQEVLVLLSQIAAIDEEWFKELSSYQRWKMISDSCMSLNVVRSSNQCKRKWEMLLDDYRKIRKWESRSREDSYWVLLEERRKDYGLPVSFQKEVFDAIDAVIQVQQHQSDSNNSDSDHIISVSEFETSNMDSDSETSVQLLPLSVHEEEGLITTSKNPEVVEFITTFKSPDKAHLMEERELITTPKSPEVVEELITTLKSPEVEELITTSKCPEERPEVEELITTSKSPEVEDFIRTSKSSEMKELFTTSKSPEKAGVTAVFEEEELITTSKSSEKTRVMAGKLHENAEHVCAILRGELQDGASHDPLPLDSLKPSAAEREFARRQADELIKALAGLTNTIDELCEYINRGECARIVQVDSNA